MCMYMVCVWWVCVHECMCMHVCVVSVCACVHMWYVWYVFV